MDQIWHLKMEQNPYEAGSLESKLLTGMMKAIELQTEKGVKDIFRVTGIMIRVQQEIHFEKYAVEALAKYIRDNIPEVNEYIDITLPYWPAFYNFDFR